MKQCLDRVAQSGSKWLTFGRFLSHIARPGIDPERGSRPRGDRRWPERKPWICHALCRSIPPVSGPASRLLDRHFGRGAHGSAGALPGDGPKAGHHTRPSWWKTARTLSPYLSITVLCFRNFVEVNFTIRPKNWSKSFATLGKKFPKNPKIVTLCAQRASKWGSGTVVWLLDGSATWSERRLQSKSGRNPLLPVGRTIGLTFGHGSKAGYC